MFQITIVLHIIHKQLYAPHVHKDIILIGIFNTLLLHQVHILQLHICYFLNLFVQHVLYLNVKYVHQGNIFVSILVQHAILVILDIFGLHPLV